MTPFFLKKHPAILLIILFLFIDAPQTDAAIYDTNVTNLPTVESVLQQSLNFFGLDKSAAQDTAAYMNASRYKKTQPQVTVTFTPNNPVPGEKVTASAQPMYFSNQPEELYYTWYLQPEICRGSLSAKDKDYCDLDKDGNVDIEDFKIKAMRLYANNGFEWDLPDAYNVAANDDDGYKAIFGGDNQQGKNDYCYFHDTKTGTQSLLSGCFHLFPNAPGHTTGDGSFNKDEEKFWHTDPNNPDTNATGYTDEANVAGLNAKEFSWTYQAGDQVGVVIEGVSVDATQVKDSSFKIMWAFLNGKCSSAVTDEHSFNECLEKNMLAPTEGGGKNEKIEVSLSYSPENPVNDTSAEGDNADWINVVSMIENSTKTESLNYDWKIYAGQYADPDGDWDSLLKNQLGKDANGSPIVEQTVGVGIPNLKFKVNFREPAPKYLKVKLTVSEKVTSGSGDGTRKGHAEVIIPLSSFNNKLSAFSTNVDDLLTLSQGEEICKITAGSTAGQLVDAAICQVAPNEIIAVAANIEGNLSDYSFLWALNGQPLSYKYIAKDPENSAKYLDNYSKDKFSPGKFVFFPVLAPKDSSLNLSLVATNQKTGAKVSLNKTFLVSEPTFKIVSADEATSKPKTLGHYIDLNGKEWPDYSQTEFLALKDSTVKLSIKQFAASPLPPEEDLPLKWYWNDTKLNEVGRELSFTATDITDSFSLSAKGRYTQDINTKKALNKYWDVLINEFYEKSLSGKVDFTLTDSIDKSDSAQKGRGKILASFISSIPVYFAFLFRMVMITFVLLSAIWILFILFPQTEKNE